MTLEFNENTTIKTTKEFDSLISLWFEKILNEKYGFQSTVLDAIYNSKIPNMKPEFLHDLLVLSVGILNLEKEIREGTLEKLIMSIQSVKRTTEEMNSRKLSLTTEEFNYLNEWMKKGENAIKLGEESIKQCGEKNIGKQLH
jgi:hypothetical protein